MTGETIPLSTVEVRPLREDDTPRADRVFRLAFGTFLGLPDPLSFFGDADYVRTRRTANPASAVAATVNGELVGSNFVTCWGSVGFFGPLTVHPGVWDRGVAKRLLEWTVNALETAGVRHAGLFTFAHSPKHVALYQKFGFWPRFLTAIMAKPVGAGQVRLGWSPLSELSDSSRAIVLEECRRLTGQIQDGLDVVSEISAVRAQQLGDTILVHEGDQLAAFAVCHTGPGTEAGSGTCYIKFGAARPGPAESARFDTLVEACETFAHQRGLQRLVAGMNLGRHEAYRRLLANGFRTEMQGVAMEWLTDAGYNRPGAFVIDDWR
jgi:GNAT superfamily N-acetyltransferase